MLVGFVSVGCGGLSRGCPCSSSHVRHRISNFAPPHLPDCPLSAKCNEITLFLASHRRLHAAHMVRLLLRGSDVDALGVEERLGSPWAATKAQASQPNSSQTPSQSMPSLQVLVALVEVGLRGRSSRSAGGRGVMRRWLGLGSRRRRARGALRRSPP